MPTVTPLEAPLREPALLSFESVAKHSSQYRADVDGLRAVAVISVVLFHLGITTVPNGYVGVDVFYVISGYLITSLIEKDLNENRFSLVRFYERRMRRIFPALFAVLLFCCLAAVVLFIPTELIEFGKELCSTNFFASNFYFWYSAKPLGYFDTGISKQPLLHTWSLAVEEQFYLLFPLVLYALFRWAKTRAKGLLLLLCLASFALNLWTTKHKPIAAFYWSAPRAWELMIGALLALNLFPLLRKRILREIAALCGLAMLLGAICLPIADPRFPGTFVLLPCVGTWLVIYAGQAGSSCVGRLLSLRPITFVGIISYSLYLWHWPIIVFAKHPPFRLTQRLELAEMLAVALCSLVLAFLSFEFIERPFRGRTPFLGRRQLFACGCAVTLASATIGIVLFRSHGLPDRYDNRTRQLIVQNVARMDDFDTSCANGGTEIHSVRDIKFCNINEQLPHKVLFFGDSLVEQLYPVMKQLSRDKLLQNHGVVTAFDPGCLPDSHLNLEAKGFHCDTFARYTLLRAQQDDIDVVFIGFSDWWTHVDDKVCLSQNERCQHPLSRDALRDRFLNDLEEEIQFLTSHGKHVIVSLPYPAYRDQIPELEISNAVFGRFGLTESPREFDSPLVRQKTKEVALRSGAVIFDPRESLCPHDQCVTEIAGVSIYKDSGHLAGSSVPLLAGDLHTALLRAFIPPEPLGNRSSPLSN